jgi:uncharacterized protein YyaL (SSP411 family)
MIAARGIVLASVSVALLLLPLLPRTQGDTVMEQLQEFTAPTSPTAEGAGSGLTPQQLSAAVSSCAAALAKGFDKKQGGFGPAPKFPRPSEINLMFRAASQA